MALTAVLVDRARVISREPARGERVEGTTQMAVVRGAWFRCRLFLDGGPGQEWEGRRNAKPGPQLMFGLRDSDGNDVRLHFDQRVEVVSNELGSAIWQITGEPQPLRRKRGLLGFLALLERVQEREFEPVEL